MAKILIVEDNPVTARMLAYAMKKAGHEYRLATTGGEALDIDESNPSDLIIMDYLLPDTNGLDLLNTFFDRDPQKLVVMVTGARRGTGCRGHESRGPGLFCKIRSFF